MAEQELLTSFATALQTTFADKQYGRLLLQIKQLFVQRDFIIIFTNTKLLSVYLSYYSPSRILLYQHKFNQLHYHSAICLGAGNGAELFGIATSQHLPSKVHISDISDYNLEPLIQSLKTNYKFPTIQISTGSVLDTEYMSSLSIESYDLLSTNFLLNEILSKSKKDFVKLIHFITTRLKKGQQWMVIDTATNFSETVLNVDDGKRVRRLMIYELLDNIEKLEKLHGDDSCWFRPDRKLKYPVKIQSIRYFYRLYVKK